MPRLAANLSMLFTEVDFLSRFELAARAGFRGVEFHFPYAHARSALEEAVRGTGLEVALHNFPPGAWEGGDRGTACHPGRGREFRESVAEALDFAAALGCRRLNCLAGVAPPDVAREQLERTLVENLRFAAKALERAGVVLLLEAINSHDMPGYFVSTSRHALEVIERVGSPNLRLQYDIYHMQIMEGDLARTLEANLGRIGHVQLADNPGRHEPGTGEINFSYLLPRLDALGYAGWVGCEYYPRAGTAEGLAWAAPFLSEAS